MRRSGNLNSGRGKLQQIFKQSWQTREWHLSLSTHYFQLIVVTFQAPPAKPRRFSNFLPKHLFESLQFAALLRGWVFSERRGFITKLWWKICRKGGFLLRNDLWLFPHFYAVLRVQIGKYFNLIGSMSISTAFSLFEFSVFVLILFYWE